MEMNRRRTGAIMALVTRRRPFIVTWVNREFERIIDAHVVITELSIAQSTDCLVVRERDGDSRHFDGYQAVLMDPEDLAPLGMARQPTAGAILVMPTDSHFKSSAIMVLEPVEMTEELRVELKRLSIDPRFDSQWRDDNPTG